MTTTAVLVFLLVLVLLPIVVLLSILAVDLVWFVVHRRKARGERRQAERLRREFRLVKGGKP